MSSPAPPSWLVACLCAGWCRTCDDYRAVMAEAARAHPGWHFAWVDIEDHADALDDADGASEDIENFPTLLLVRDGVPHFFGPLLPNPGVLARLLAQAAAGQLPPVSDTAAQRLAFAVGRLVHRAPQAVAV
jgi:thiol-disulfide isomerase/thioredoxin